jgi:teichuronic acid biosynthesis glycosyltransferase TuaG
MQKSNSTMISVVMPAFNSASFIDAAIQSVITQTYTSWELIIADGGSTDETHNIIQNKIRLYPTCSIILLKNEYDQGPADARSFAIQSSRGAYVAFLDADDIWHESKLAKQIEYMEKERIEFCYTLFHRISPSGKIISGPLHAKKNYTYKQYLKKRGIGNSTVILKKELLSIDVINTVTKYAEDTLWWLLILKKNHKAICLDLDLVGYRISPNGLSRNIFLNQIKVFQMYTKSLRITFLLAVYYHFLYLCDVIIRRIGLLIDRRRL